MLKTIILHLINDTLKQEHAQWVHTRARTHTHINTALIKQAFAVQRYTSAPHINLLLHDAILLRADGKKLRCRDSIYMETSVYGYVSDIWLNERCCGISTDKSNYDRRVYCQSVCKKKKRREREIDIERGPSESIHTSWVLNGVTFFCFTYLTALNLT